MIDVPDDDLLAPAEDSAPIAAPCAAGGPSEAGMTALIKTLLHEEDTAVDQGGNIGLRTLPMARAVGSSGRVIAIEPVSRACNLHRRDLILNGVVGQTSLHGCEEGDLDGRSLLHRGEMIGHSSPIDLPYAKDGEEVEVRTVDPWCQLDRQCASAGSTLAGSGRKCGVG